MNRLLNRILLNKQFPKSPLNLARHRPDIYVQYKYLNTPATAAATEETENQFGIGSKYARLDSRKTENFNDFIKKHNNKVRNQHVVDNDSYLYRKYVAGDSEGELDDPDKFGTITNEFNSIAFQTSISSSRPTPDHVAMDEDEAAYDKVLDHIRLSNDSYKPHTDKYYSDRMRSFAEENKIEEAVSVFYDEMIERDRFKPNLWLFKDLMKILAKVGYTHMVFALFKKLTDSKLDEWTKKFERGYLEKIVTILFVACSNSQFPEYAIRKTDSIRVYLKNRDIQPNYKMYSAMITAYGKQGAIYEAFNVVDEMLALGLKLNIDIYNNLLFACNSDRDHGFKYALEVWQMCLKSNIKPSLNMYSLLLKAAKDCHIDPANRQKLINYKVLNLRTVDKTDNQTEEQCEEPVETFDFNESDGFFEEPKDVTALTLKPEDVQIIQSEKVIADSLKYQIEKLEWWQDIKTNLNKKALVKELSKYKIFDQELSNFKDISNYESLLTKSDTKLVKKMLENVKPADDTPMGRFNMLGGIEGFSRSILHHQVKPNFKTINAMLQVLPNGEEQETQLMNLMDFYKIKIDVDFINLLIKRRLFRRDFKGSENALKLLQENQLSPNIYTFGSLANGVNNLIGLKRFLEDMKNLNFELNPIILSTLLAQGFRHTNSDFLLFLFEYLKSNKIKLNSFLVLKIESSLAQKKKKILEYERKLSRKECESTEHYKLIANFYSPVKAGFQKLQKHVKVEEIQHPYERFSRGPEDKLFHSFKKRTEGMKLRTDAD